MSLILDLIFLLLAFYCMYLGYKRGFIRSILGMLGSVAIMFISYYFSGIISDWIYEVFFKPQIMQSLAENLKSLQYQSINQTVDLLTQRLPNFVVGAAALCGITADKIALSISNNLQNPTQGIEVLLRPVILRIVRFFVIMVLFGLFNLLLRFISKILHGAIKILHIGKINALLGLILSLAQYIMIVCFFLYLVKFLIPQDIANEQIFSVQSIQKTAILSKIYNKLPDLLMYI